jgi:DNA polymerase V
MHGSSPDLDRPRPAYTGFSSAGEDFRDRRLNLNELVVRRPASTFFLRAGEGAELGGGIEAGDILVVDRALEPASGSLVVAVAEGEMLLRMLLRRGGRTWIAPAPGGEGAREVTRETDLRLWGVVTYVVRAVDPR